MEPYTMPPDPPVLLGTILESTWGYDQTNCDFYQVVAVSPTAKTITLQKIKSHEVVSDGISMTGKVMPVPGAFDGEPKKYKWHPRKPYKGGGSSDPFVKIESYAYAYIWDGRPVSISWYG